MTVDLLFLQFWYKSNAAGGRYYCAERTIQRPRDGQGPYSSTCYKSCWGRRRKCIIHFEIQRKDANKAVDAFIPVLSDIMSNITLQAVFCQHPTMEAGIPLHVCPIKVWCMRQVAGGHREVGPTDCPKKEDIIVTNELALG
jgi:hypothetical protein